MLADPCADPGIFARWSRPDCQKTALTTFLSFFVLNFYSSFTVAYQWFISKKTIILQGFGGGGGPTYSRGGGGRGRGRGLGVQMLILETHRTFDFQGGDADPLSPLDPHI